MMMMHIKTEKEIVDGLIKKYLIKEENILNINHLFTAISVIRWIFRTTKEKQEILSYLTQVERFLSGEIKIYWEGDIIKIGKRNKS